MRIRTITAGISIGPDRIDEQVERASGFLGNAKDAFRSGGWEVQTLRISTQPWPKYGVLGNQEALLSTVRQLEAAVRKGGVDFVSIGSASDPKHVRMLPSILEETSIVSTSVDLGSREGGVRDELLAEAAQAVLDISRISRDGSRNFMFASISNCRPDIPFFPASYHAPRSHPSFTIGIESGGLVRSCMEASNDLRELKGLLSQKMGKELSMIEAKALSIEGKGGPKFKGIDTSINPGLGEEASVALGAEKFIGSSFGSQGTLSVCASLTGALSTVDVRRCGFCGLMLPVLEDAGLCRAADAGSLDLQKLLLYSSVCGTGLDAVPVPGSAPVSRLCSVLKDVAYLACRLDKPLTARLLPVPGKEAGEMTELKLEYTMDCAILPLV